MDLNSLLFSHQVALIRADELSRIGGIPCGSAIADLAGRINVLRAQLGVTQYALELGA
ncbi:MAG: hypothetical protein KGZ65_12210 [Sphingomonadales bacterium]|nr:hypothetical protein [Sphingomonadaceae bacterium]MBS3931991.1 hypothetical protein [Sphingomonadales bacterium]